MIVNVEQLIIGTPKVGLAVKPSFDMKCSKCGRPLFSKEADDYVRLKFDDDTIPGNLMPVKVCCVCQAEYGFPWNVISFLSFINKLLLKGYRLRLDLTLGGEPIEVILKTV